MNQNKFFVDLPPEVNQEENNNNSKFGYIKYIVIIIALIITFGFVYYAFSNRDEGTVDTINFEDTPIVINDELLSELRSLIPKNDNCSGVYYSRQYQDGLFKDENIVKNELYSKECNALDKIYYVNVDNKSDIDFVYIYDKVMLFNPKSEMFGNTYNNYDIDFGLVELDYNETLNKKSPSKDSIMIYGRIYKYTFQKMDNGIYLYVSTEPYAT